MDYFRPPILEAAIQFGWSGDWSIDDLDSALGVDDFDSYSEKYEIRHLDAKININKPEVSSTVEHIGFGLRSEDGGERLELTSDFLRYTQTAPYRGWNDFAPHAIGALRVLAPRVGVSGLDNVQIRFVNRLDVPYGEDGSVDINSYINVDVIGLYGGPAAIQDLQLKVLKKVEGSDLRFGLSMAVLKSPMPDHAGIFLDIEMYNSAGLSMAAGVVERALEELRSEKNNAFEATITEQTRELFGGIKQ